MVISPLGEALNLGITTKAIANKIEEVSTELQRSDESSLIDDDHAIFSKELPFLGDSEEL